MWIDRVRGNIADRAGTSGPPIDPVDVRWDECGRTLKKTTRGGLPIRVLLPPGQQFRHGDILFEDAAKMVIIHVVPCQVIVACPSSHREFGTLCLELGNLHWPAEVTDAEVIFVEDGPAMSVIDQLGVSWSKQERRFQPTSIGSGPGVQLSREFKVIRA